VTHPPINFEKLPPIEKGRLGRALFLGTARIGDGQFRVFNPLTPLDEESTHHVDLYSSDIPRCDCGDHEYRGMICKHILACLLVERHPVVADALVEHMSRR
jgi:hypothetical protein